MELRRLYNEPPAPGALPQIRGVRVNHTGQAAEQNWDRGQVLQYASEGWMRLKGDTLEITAENATLVYDVLRYPGYYVRSTGEQIPISELALQQFYTEPVATLAPAEARAFLAGKGLPVDDYEASRIYSCRLRADLHEMWRAVRDPLSGNPVAAHTVTTSEA